MLDLLNVNYSEHDRTKIDPYELDFYLQDFDIAIEFNGYPYHTEKYKDKNYHLNKTLLCNKKGIQLIHIFYDELENKPLIIFNRLKSILKKETKRIYARKCDIKEITHKEAKEFCEKYHLQGYTNSSVKLGLYYKNELVSLMTFSKYSISKGSNNKDFS
jgi:very-short-patch-repair endonuclease